MKTRFLTAAQALARMKKGDLPTRGGGYTSALFFADGARTSGPTGYRLRKAGKIVPPSGSACDTPYTLPTSDADREHMRQLADARFGKLDKL